MDLAIEEVVLAVVGAIIIGTGVLVVVAGGLPTAARMAKAKIDIRHVLLVYSVAFGMLVVAATLDIRSF